VALYFLLFNNNPPSEFVGTLRGKYLTLYRRVSKVYPIKISITNLQRSA